MRVSRLLVTFVVICSAALSFAAPANAVANNVSVTASNTAPGASSTLAVGLSGYQTSVAVKCLSVKFSGGYIPSSTLATFDSSAQGWSDGYAYGATVTQSTAYSHSGAGSLQMTQNVTSKPYNAVTDNINHGNMSAGGNELSAWVYQPVSVPGTFASHMAVMNPSYAYVPGPSFTLQPGQWTFVSYVVPTSLLTNMNTLAVAVDSSSSSGTQSLYIDDVQQGPDIGGFGGQMPTGMVLASATLSGSYPGGTWSTDATTAASGVLAFNNSSGATPTGSSSTFSIGSITQPTDTTGQTVYVTVATYSGVGSGSSGTCTGSILDGPFNSAYAVTPVIAVSVTVDPTMTFTVAPKTGTCNGVTLTGTSTATSVNLGHINSTSAVSAAQFLTTATNAGNGVSIYTRYSGPINDGSGHTISDVPGNGGWFAGSTFPTTGTAAFGYSYDWTGPNKWINMTTSNANNVSWPVGGGTGCIVYQAQTAATTPAGSYSTTVYYTAVPSY